MHSFQDTVNKNRNLKHLIILEKKGINFFPISCLIILYGIYSYSSNKKYIILIISVWVKNLILIKNK